MCINCVTHSCALSTYAYALRNKDLLTPANKKTFHFFLFYDTFSLSRLVTRLLEHDYVLFIFYGALWHSVKSSESKCGHPRFEPSRCRFESRACSFIPNYSSPFSCIDRHITLAIGGHLHMKYFRALIAAC